MSDVSTRLLRAVLRGRMTTEATSGCVDADTLAAWSDGALRARERVVVESHASNCARCQALLAAMARTTPPMPVHRWWRTSTVGWLVPLAAGAAAIALLIYVPRTRLERSPVLPRGVAPDASASAVTAEPSRPSTTSTAPANVDDRRDESKTTVAAQGRARDDEPRASAAPAGAAPPVVQRQEQANLAPSRALDAAAEGRVAAAPPSATAAPSVADLASPIARPEAVPRASPGASPSQVPTPAAAARATTDAAASGVRVQAFAKALAVPTQIMSPDPNVRWRILTSGSVERSVDGGTTWQTQSTGARATLTAGAAPSPTICWLVGPGGVVVVSIDGRTWQRVAFPESIDLTSVRASDGANATVTAADGRTFTTIDGGKTWRSA